MAETDRWGHPLAGANLRLGSWWRAQRKCVHCGICQQRAVRAGITLARYYKLHPETLAYRGFPVVAARTGRASGWES